MRRFTLEIMIDGEGDVAVSTFLSHLNDAIEEVLMDDDKLGGVISVDVANWVETVAIPPLPAPTDSPAPTSE